MADFVNAGINSGALTVVASTGPNGFVLVNGTPTILSWTAPTDNSVHSVLLNIRVDVSVTQTGGAVTLAIAGKTLSLTAPFGGGGTGGTSYVPSGGTVNVALRPGETVSLVQSSAQTAGAGTVYAELLAT